MEMKDECPRNFFKLKEGKQVCTICDDKRGKMEKKRRVRHIKNKIKKNNNNTHIWKEKERRRKEGKMSDYVLHFCFPFFYAPSEIVIRSESWV